MNISSTLFGLDGEPYYRWDNDTERPAGHAGFEEKHPRCQSPKAPQRPAARMVDIGVFRAFGRW